jgi:hypothetical protein
MKLERKLRITFQIKMREIEYFWIPISTEFLKDTLDENEYKSIRMMVRCSFAPGKANRGSEFRELICITIIFSSGHIRG